MVASRPPISSTKSRACAISSASHSSSSVASPLPYRRLDRTVPVNRYACCGTSPILARSTSGSSVRMSAPLTRTSPPVTSTSLGTRFTSVVLPAPVLPMIAVVLPASARKEMSRSTGSAAPG